MGDLAEIVKAYDIRGVVGQQLDDELAGQFGAAFARLMVSEAATGVVVGHDMRTSSPGLAEAFASGVCSQGLDVVWIGLASTDQLYFASGSLNMPGAMLTASHNPAHYNGIKLCRAGAAPVGQDSGLTELRAVIEQGVPEFAGATGSITERDVLGGYRDFLRSLVDLSAIRPLTIVVDAANGMAGHTAPAVFAGLPIELDPMYFELDGSFPNHPADPLDPANLADLQHRVRERGADAGLAFDGDADRCFVVDERGEPVPPSSITALVALRVLETEPGATIIYNLITSQAVPEFVAEHGGNPLRSRVGHSFIKALMAETDAVFGGEHSAHYYFRDFYNADTGMLAALHLLAALGGQDGPLSTLAAAYQRYAASGEINSTVSDPAACQQAVKDAYAGRNGAQVDELDGVTVRLADGAWFNLRGSNTEPLLRLNVEAADENAVASLTGAVLDIIRA